MFSDQYVIKFAESCPSEDVKEYISSCLEVAKLYPKREELHDRSSVITIGASFQVLADKAEEIGLEKKEKHGGLSKFSVEKFDDYEGSGNEENFFTAAERSYVINACLQSLEYEQGKLSALGVQLGSDSLIAGCQHSKPKVLESCFPLHNPSEQTQLWKKMKSNFFLSPLKEIRDYYGEGVAFYFGWMACFTWTLIPVAFMGVLMYFFKPPGVTVDDNPLLPFYEVIMAFWAISFLAIWKRKESEYSFLWNTYSVEDSELIRPEFHGIIRTSPITGKPEKYFPHWKRWLRFALSFVLTLPVLCIAVGAMICSLNLNGYIKDKESPVYLPTLAYFAEPGHIFAADSKYYGYLIPTVAHSVVINILNKLYRTVAHFCTDMENHRTEREWDNSLIIKRVLFEVFDCFLPLFYIAFYQLNVVALRRELVGLFWGDEIRRLVTESGLPYLTEKAQILKKKRDLAKKKKTDDKDIITPSQAEEDCMLEEYDQFDDYLEMVVQFGYVTLFASAFPLAAAVSIVFLFIEAHSDLFKLLFIYQRPKVVRSRGIGVWYNVLYAMMILSMLTNSLIVGFSSEQLASWFPWMYETIDGDQFIKLGYGRYVVAIVFSCEHFLILCVAVARWCVSSRPKWVRVAIAKRNYEKEIELKVLERREKTKKKAE